MTRRRGIPPDGGVSGRLDPPRRNPRIAARPNLWSLLIGADPAVLSVAERPREGGAVYARWHDPEKPGSEPRRSRALGIKVRTAAGDLDAALCDEAEVRAHELYRELFPADLWTPPAGGWVTLSAGFARALDEDGAFARSPAGTRTTYRYADTLVTLFGHDTAWDQLTPRALRAGWQRLAKDRPLRVAGTVGAGGATAARSAFEVLFTTARWLRGEGLIPPGAAVPPPRWRAQLAGDWRALTRGAR